jgi:hypothetical protein
MGGGAGGGGAAGDAGSAGDGGRGGDGGNVEPVPDPQPDPDPSHYDACATAVSVSAQSESECTQVIGFSQTSNWYGNEAEPWFESSAGIDDDRWQLWWHRGAGVESWADPEYKGWDPNNPSTHLVSPCTSASSTPDRVVFTISSNLYNSESPAADWAAEITNAVATTRSKIPSADEIVLQPVVGGTPQGACDTRASANYPKIVDAIQLALEPGVVAGASPQVGTCEAFSDEKGHISSTHRMDVGAMIAACYAK